MSRRTSVSAVDPHAAPTSAAAEDAPAEVISEDARALLDSVGRVRRSLALGRALIELYGRKADPSGGQQTLARPARDPDEVP
jgi:hypothetical protein